MTALLLNVIAFIIRRRWLLTQRLECAHATIMVQEPVFTSLYISHSGVSIEIRAAVDQTEDKIVWSKMTASKKKNKNNNKATNSLCLVFIYFLSHVSWEKSFHRTRRSCGREKVPLIIQ